MKNILVIGDSILDKYWFGDTSRISPEAPVPVVRIDKQDLRLGGAANVANNIASVGIPVSFLSMVGDDLDGQLLLNLLKEKNINANLIISNENITTVKLRVLARNQQICRCDFEKIINKSFHKVIYNKFIEELNKSEIIIFSDYNKGLLSNIEELIKLAKKQNKFVIVDPKNSDFSKYAHANIVTPNRNELKLAIGSWDNEDDLTRKVNILLDKYDIEYILLTRSEEGMTLFGKGIKADIPTEAKEVFDVSGAGDTVVAIVSAMISEGNDLLSAVKVANKAAGIVVAKIGTSTISQDEYSQIK